MFLLSSASISLSLIPSLSLSSVSSNCVSPILDIASRLWDCAAQVFSLIYFGSKIAIKEFGTKSEFLSLAKNVMAQIRSSFDHPNGQLFHIIVGLSSWLAACAQGIVACAQQMANRGLYEPCGKIISQAFENLRPFFNLVHY